MSFTTKLQLAIVVLASLFCVCSAVEIRLFPVQPASLNPRYKKFTFSDAQVCYSLDSCYDDIAVKAAWLNAPHGYRFTFYEGAECSGNALRVTNVIASGIVDFTKVNFVNKLSSFIMVGPTDYAVQGLEDICQDENAMLTRSAVNISLPT